MAMLMRIAWGRLKPGHWDAFEEDYRKVNQNLYFPGLTARYLIQDVTQKDSGFSITVWKSEEDLKEYEASELRSTLTKEIERHFSGVFNVQRCRIKMAQHFEVDEIAGGSKWRQCRSPN